MKFVALGSVGAMDGDRSVRLGSARHRAVFGLLLAHVGHPVPIDVITTEVWGDGAGDGAVASLYTHVSNLRRAIGKDRIVSESGQYRLVLHDSDEVDVTQFEDALSKARHRSGIDPSAAVGALEEALGLWRGRAYEGLDDVPTLASESIRLNELRVKARVDRFDSILQAGDAPHVADLEELCRQRPLDERPWELLMRTLYRTGRHAEALRTFAHVRALFGDEMGIEPSPTLARLEEQILLHDPALDAASTAHVAGLPVYLTSFVGRDEEMQALGEALGTHRLVTVLGPGGVGKTRLATETAMTLGRRFPDGIWLIDLAQISDPSRIGQAIGQAIGVTGGVGEPLDEVVRSLRGRRSLLVLDNCEHLIDRLRDVAGSLLSRAPGLVILTTSRHPLGIGGEQRFLLEGLSLDTSDDSPSDASLLFAQRAEEAGWSVDLDGGSAEKSVTAVCRKLDGMPLALELAAARSDVLSPAEIAGLLTHRFALLVDKRQDRDIHRSLEATVGWSYGLLDADQRRAFEYLGVFEGQFTAQAAAAVLGQDAEAAVRTLEDLLAASLIRVESRDGGTTKYRLLETLRAYAGDRLRESECWRDAVDRHDTHYGGVCRLLHTEFFGAGRAAATDRIEMELAEYVAIWDRRMDIDPVSVLPLAWPLGNYWMFGGVLQEGIVRLEELLELTDGTSSLERADALIMASWVAAFRNRPADAIRWTTEAVDILRETDEELRLAYALARGGHWAFGQGQAEAGLALLSESLEICDRIGFEDGKAWPVVLIAQARIWIGDESNEVEAMLLEARRRFSEMEEPFGQIHADMLIGRADKLPINERHRIGEEMVAVANHIGGENTARPTAFHAIAYPTWDIGETDRAEGLNRICVRSALASGNEITLGMGLYQAAVFASRRENPERAARLFGAGSSHFGMDLPPFYATYLRPDLDYARAAIGDEQFDEIHRLGAALGIREAAEYALGRS